MVEKKTREYLLKEIGSVRKVLNKSYKKEPELLQNNLLPIAAYLLGENNHALDTLGINEINTIVSEIAVSLRYPAFVKPFNHITYKSDSKLTNVNHFFEQFNNSGLSSKMGCLFSVMHSELFGHLALNENKSAYCTPIKTSGFTSGIAAYFPDSDQRIFKDQIETTYSPFANLVMADDTQKFYQDFAKLRGAVLIYLYSIDTNAFFLSNGKGSIQGKQFQIKDEIKVLKEKIIQAFQNSPMHDEPPILSLKEDQIKDENLKSQLKAFSAQILETRKHYTVEKIREASKGKQEKKSLYYNIFNALPYAIHMSAAVLWVHVENEKWEASRVIFYREKTDDPNDCVLEIAEENTIKDLFGADFSTLFNPPKDNLKGDYSKFLSDLFHHKADNFQQINECDARRLNQLFKYEGKSWANYVLGFKSHFVLPINDTSGTEVPEMIFDLYFGYNKKEIDPWIYDALRLVSKLFKTVKAEIELTEIREATARHTYMGKLIHEVRNWLMQMVNKMEIIDSTLALQQPSSDDIYNAKSSVAFSKLKLLYFEKLFNIIIAEAKGSGKYIHEIEKENFELYDDIFNQVKAEIIDACIDDKTLRTRVGRSMKISSGKEGDWPMRNTLEQKIQIRGKNVSIFASRVLIFVAVQEMLRNAVLYHNWEEEQSIVMESDNSIENHISIKVTNYPRAKGYKRIKTFCRSVVDGVDDGDVGFGTLWLKSIKTMVKGSIQVDQVWRSDEGIARLLDGDNTLDRTFTIKFNIPVKNNIKETAANE